jgi:paraquat-inducible protein A
MIKGSQQLSMAESRQTQSQTTTPGAKLIACENCDLLQQEISFSERNDAHCVRCDALLYRGPRVKLDAMLALVIGSAVLLVISNLFPIAVLSAEGAYRSTTLFGAVLALYDQSRPFVAVLVLLTAILIPALELSALLYMLLPLHFGHIPKDLPITFRFLLAVHPWSMMEVFMLGILVTLVKLSDLATVVPGISVWAFAGLIILFSGISASFSIRDFWQWVEEASQKKFHSESGFGAAIGRKTDRPASGLK